jgi:hypothetical protein
MGWNKPTPPEPAGHPQDLTIAHWLMSRAIRFGVFIITLNTCRNAGR